MKTINVGRELFKVYYKRLGDHNRMEVLWEKMKRLLKETAEKDPFFESVPVPEEMILEGYAGACEEWKDRIKNDFASLFPKDRRFEFVKESYNLTTSWSQSGLPFMITAGLAPKKGDYRKSIAVDSDYEVKLVNSEGHTLIEFHKKK